MAAAGAAPVASARQAGATAAPTGLTEGGWVAFSAVLAAAIWRMNRRD